MNCGRIGTVVVAVLTCFGNVPGQEAVAGTRDALTVASDLDAAAVRRLASRLGLSWTCREAGRVASSDVDLWVFVDLGRVQRLAQDRMLHALPAVGTDEVFVEADDHTFRARCASTWVLAWRSDRESERSDGIEALIDPRWGTGLLVPAPGRAPDLWFGWIREQILRRGTEDAAFAWAATIDARVLDYVDPWPERRTRLLQDPRARLAVLPIEALTDDLGRSLVWQALDPSPARLLCEAVAAGPRAERALADLAVLSGRAAIPAMREELGLLPAAPVQLGQRARAQRDALRIAPAAAEERATAWLARFTDHVRGQGRFLEVIDEAADWVFAGLFIAFLVWAWRSIGRGEREPVS